MNVSKPVVKYCRNGLWIRRNKSEKAGIQNCKSCEMLIPLYLEQKEIHNKDWLYGKMAESGQQVAEIYFGFKCKSNHKMFEILFISLF
jgi:hypothetical protein